MDLNKLIFIGSVGGPLMRSGANGSITILNKEYIGDMPISSLFNGNLYELNPGLAKTFPWLSQVADSYEEYRIKALAFTFKSTSTPYVKDQLSMSFGTVMMAVQYNVNNAPFTNKRDMENYTGATSGSPLQSQVFVMRPDQDPLKVLYIRQGTPITKNYDLKFYDFGRFEFATVGMNVDPNATANTCGELWVSYEIELIKPRLRSITSRIDHYMMSNGSTGIWSTNYPLGNHDLINAVTPPLSASNAYNGIFNLGTQIIKSNHTFVSQAGAVACAAVLLPDSMADKFFVLEFQALTTNGAQLVTVGGKKLDLLVEIDPSAGVTVPYAMFSKIGGLGELEGENPNDAVVTFTGSTYYCKRYFKTNAMNGDNLKQLIYFAFRTTGATSNDGVPFQSGVNNDVSYELIITEVDERFFIKPT
ncbi:capsid protein [Crucivirus-497]|nr:capsid protein [Crucivirus-497]